MRSGASGWLKRKEGNEKWPKIPIHCERCGRKATTKNGHLPAKRDADGEVEWAWEGSVSGAVCPGCQYAEWHPHCTSVRAESGYGERIDFAALRRGEQVIIRIDDMPVVLRSADELDWNDVAYCDYIDPSVSWIDHADWPEQWTCPECGGTDFEGVHRDYQASGLKGAAFTADVNEIDESD